MPSSPAPDRQRTRRWILPAAIVFLALLGAIVFVLLHSPGNVSHPNLSFTGPSTTGTTTTAPPKPPVVDTFVWPRYGFDAPRTREFAGPAKLRPPLRVGWRFGGNALLEFPPVIYHTTLFFIDDGATAKAVDKRTGHQLWATHLGTLSASSPAIGVREGLVFFTVLSRNRGAGQTPGNGAVDALSMRTGRVVWSHALPSGTESSPLAWKGTLYLGDQAGTVFSINAATGHVNWTFQASGAVKGGPALANGVLYFGDYAGRVYALNAASGRKLWAVTTSGSAFGFGSGNFYSTPAVAFGRVYMGNTDGRVYSFAAGSGQLAWATGTGAYVYASAAVADVRGLGPTVFMGSYDGNFYAFGAQSGGVRWRHPSGGRISGAATIIDGVVYYSVLGSRTTIGLDAATGRQVFSFPDGAFNAAIADAGAIYLSGYDTLYQLLPKPPAPARRPTPPAARHTHVAAGARSRKTAPKRQRKRRS